ncbi:hypothetical protein DB346_10945 [Verrucomicrobia bacterium LW23]|nr:hypothetical protein DB346_10945 [Verrucomicrobia bacterium LW23]
MLAHLSRILAGAPSFATPRRAHAQRRRSARAGFTLTELVVVIGVILTIGAISGPALRTLNGAGSVSRASEDLARTMELARTFAMANQTYVRVAISDEVAGTMVVLPIYSADGTLDADGAADMASAQKWPVVAMPLMLSNFRMDDTLNASTPATSGDQVPSSTNISGMRRAVQGLGSNPSGVMFSKFIQFNPNGEARVVKGATARYIKLGLHKSEGNGGGRSANPFVVRVSGVNGTVSVLRKEQGVGN